MKPRQLVLSRAGIQRMLTHFSTKKFAIVSPTQPRPYCNLPDSLKVIQDLPQDHPNPPEAERVKTMKKILKTLRIGYIKMDGFWKSESGTSKDNSFFIPKPVSLSAMKDIGRYFNQEGIIYGDGNRIWLWEQPGKKSCAPYAKSLEFKLFKTGEGEFGFSEMKKKKGRKFYFSSTSTELQFHIRRATAIWFPKRKIEKGSIIVTVSYRRGKFTYPLIIQDATSEFIEAAGNDPDFGKEYDYFFVV